MEGRGSTHVHPIIFANKIELSRNWDMLGFGVLHSTRQKGREGAGIPSGCSSPAPAKGVGGRW